jgi:hypothetical protein
LMHTALADGMVRARQADLLRAAEQHRLGRLAAGRRRRSVRDRLGWWLVEVGLRLALA